MNPAKTMVMRCHREKEQVVSQDSEICGDDFGCNSIVCTTCSSELHKGCSDISGCCKAMLDLEPEHEYRALLYRLK